MLYGRARTFSAASTFDQSPGAKKGDNPEVTGVPIDLHFGIVAVLSREGAYGNGHRIVSPRLPRLGKSVPARAGSSRPESSPRGARVLSERRPVRETGVSRLLRIGCMGQKRQRASDFTSVGSCDRKHASVMFCPHPVERSSNSARALKNTHRVVLTRAPKWSALKA